SAAVGDVNGDTKLDIITTHDDVTLMTILIGDGKGGFTPAPNSPFDLGHRAYKVIIIDLNQDNRIDMVMCGYPKYVIALLGDGKGGFANAQGLPFEVGDGPNGIVVGDFNGDNNLDIATANSGSNNVTVLLGNGRKTR
ncbi:MAG: VCBS repeat-containing protein, partial [Ignavibacteria bacterium]|nr:VCBS repeat-containing protein [Ignavibacteria bacterium]